MPLPFDEAMSAAIRELNGYRDDLRAAGESCLSNATELPGWDIEGLTRHVCAAGWQQAEAFHRARLGITEPPSYLEVRSTDLIDAINVVREHLELAVKQLPSGDPIVPLPFVSLPAQVAAYVLLIEYGIHRWDLARALGGSREVAADVTSTIIELVPAMLPLFTGELPDEPIVYRVGSSTIAWNGETWQSGVESAHVDCEIRGGDEAIALYSLGRIPFSHPSLEVIDDGRMLAQQFKTFFPGP